MTRTAGPGEIRAPFDGTTLELRADRAALRSANGQRYMELASSTRGDLLFRVTKVIGGRYREDFAGVPVDAADPEGPAIGEERVLPVSYLLWNGQLRYKGYSVLVRERSVLEPGVVWRQTCIFCHNTTSQFSSLYDEIYGPGAPSYQGSTASELPSDRGFRYRVTDPDGLVSALNNELAAQGIAADLRGLDARDALRQAMRATNEHFDERGLLEIGIGCEACHGGSAAHVKNPVEVRPSFALRSDFLDVTAAGEFAPSHTENVNRACARCHTVLFTRYPYTWEGGTRRRQPGGSNINSGEARDLLLSRCGSSLSCASCHDPHGEDSKEALDALSLPGKNAVCTRCHDRLQGERELRAHTHHAPDSAGSACVGCHMPRKNMGLAYELTRYHRIGSPTDRERVEGDRPLECALCHADKTVHQIVTTIERLWNKSYDRAALERLYGANLDVNVLRATLLGGKPHERATAASVAAEHHRVELLPSLAAAVSDEYPLVRYFIHHALERLAGEPVPLDLTAPAAEVAGAAEQWLNTRRAANSQAAP